MGKYPVLVEHPTVARWRVDLLPYIIFMQREGGKKEKEEKEEREGKRCRKSGLVGGGM